MENLRFFSEQINFLTINRRKNVRYSTAQLQAQNKTFEFFQFLVFQIFQDILNSSNVFYRIQV